MVVLITSGGWRAGQLMPTLKGIALRGAEQNRYYNVTPMHSAKANAFIEQEFIYDRITD
ncbi:hypothetical protein [Vreelandella olivaria]|uniref:hypothetical protein n=1 Tax=Vreelandella olivaria TaxID=390919 RepID=UPI00201ECC8F|nr:hypothetical protein [Halomonas olivaria]